MKKALVPKFSFPSEYRRKEESGTKAFIFALISPTVFR
jgi:hypothetical protein